MNEEVVVDHKREDVGYVHQKAYKKKSLKDTTNVNFKFLQRKSRKHNIYIGSRPCQQ